MSDVIPLAGAVGSLRMLTDGSISVSITFEPKDRVAVMQMMGSPGQPIACVPLVTGFAAASDKPKATYADLGPICKEAIDLCKKDSAFHRYVEHATRVKHGDSMRDIDKARVAKSFICTTCQVESRQELDTAEGARQLFIEHVRKPFHAWLRTQS